nr:hypothetical protein [Streptomyces qinglanensis]
MAVQQLNAAAPARPPYRTSRPCARRRTPVTAPPTAPHPGRGRPGVVHVRHRHRERFTVVGNHLAQHRELSLLAIGLGVHIQSVPDGTRVDIKSLTARFPEGEARIAAALRELEAYGYLTRTPQRTPGGRIVTHTVSYANPAVQEATSPRVPPQAAPTPPPAAEPEPAPVPARVPDPGPAPVPYLPHGSRAPEPAGAKPAAADPTATTHAPPATGAATAAAVLAALRRDDDRLLLSERDVARLSPAVETWLARNTGPEAVRRALTSHLPAGPLRSPAALLLHRLTARLPVPLPGSPPPGARPDPFQECPDCERPFRAPAPGRCRTCRTEATEAAEAAE